MHHVKKFVGRFGVYEVTAFVSGFVLMAYELAASRLLAPTIGASTYVWTSVIGIMIAALATGYAVGGWLADLRVAKGDVAWLLIFAALMILYSGVAYESILVGITAWFSDERLQGVAAAVVLFMPASFLLGAISPYLARLRVHSVATTGRSIAGLSACNSVGGNLGTFCTGFLFFSFMGLRQTLVLLAAALLATSWLLVPRYRLRQRLGATLCLGLIMLLQITQPVSAGIIATIETPSAHYTVADAVYEGEQIRVLSTGPNGTQSGIYVDDHDKLVFDYTRKLAELVAENDQRDHILILGGGAFTLPEYLGKHHPESQIDVVEIDPKLQGISEQYFGYEQPANVQTYAQDGRTFLTRTPQKYDIVIVDVYNDVSVPFSLATEEYARAAKRVLTDKGVVMANIIGSVRPNCEQYLASLHASYAAVFGFSRFFPVIDKHLLANQNIIALYANTRPEWVGSASGGQPVALFGGQKLTDNFAPVEWLHQRCESA